MASDYRVGAGHDIALVSLTVLSPQPRSLGVQVTERSYGLAGSVHERGLWLELIYDYIETPTEYQNLIATLGVNSALYANVTIYAWRKDYDYARYNAVVHRPQLGQDGGWDNFFLRNVKFLFRNMVAI